MRLLEEDRARLAAVLQHLPVGVLLADRNGRLIGSNKETERIWEGDHPLIKNTTEYQSHLTWHLESGKVLLPEEYPLATALRTGQPVQPVEMKLRRFDGSEKTILAYAAPIKNGRGLVGAVAVNVDITERKRLEEALRESEFRFRAMADGTPVMIWVTDPTGRMEFINQAYSQFFDVSLEEVQAGTWQVLVHPDDHASYITEYMSCLREQRPFHAQCRVLRKNGEWRWIISHAQPRLSENGEFLGMAGSSLDITERKQIEDALKESQSMLAEAQRIAGVGSWRWNIQTGEVEWSDELYAIYGVDRTTFRPTIHSFASYIYPEDAQLVEENIKKITAGGAPVDFAFRIINQAGQLRVLRSVGQVTQWDADGSPLMMIGANQDITEQRQAERALKESEEHFRVAITNSPILVYTCDRDLRYTWIYNPPFGVEAGQILGKTDEELNGPEAVAELKALKTSVLETGVGNRKEIEFQYEGGVYYFDVTAEPIRDENGEITGLTVAALDITEKKRMEKVVQEHKVQIELHHRLLEEREQERLSVAQDIHDGPIQTLVAALLRFQVAKNKLSDPTLQREFDQTETNLNNAIWELRDIISDLRPPLLERSGFSAVLKSYADDFIKKYPGLQIACEVVEDQGELSKDVSLSLFRIYQEALNNVARHAGATQVVVRFYFEERNAILEIEDNGKGMQPDQDFMILTEEGHYGLAGMKERADAVNGEFQFVSAVGAGTTVRIKVPILPGEGEKPA